MGRRAIHCVSFTVLSPFTKQRIHLFFSFFHSYEKIIRIHYFLQNFMEMKNAHSRTIMADRLVMVWMWLNGASARRISSHTGASVSTVYRWIRRWNDEGTLETRPYCGRHFATVNRKRNSLCSDYSHEIRLPTTPNLPYSVINSSPFAGNNVNSGSGLGSTKMDPELHHICYTSPFYSRFNRKYNSLRVIQTKGT